MHIALSHTNFYTPTHPPTHHVPQLNDKEKETIRLQKRILEIEAQSKCWGACVLLPDIMCLYSRLYVCICMFVCVYVYMSVCIHA
jgi:hypothetical protein